MAMGWIWTAMVGLSVLCGGIMGRMNEVSAAALVGAAAAVELCFGMLGGMCLWMGVMELMERSGLAAVLAALFRPLLRRLLPRVGQDEETLAARKAAWVCPEPRIKTGYLARYAKLVSSAARGAVLE